VIRISDLGDGALVLAAGQSMQREADWRLAVVGGATARAELAGVVRLAPWEFAVDAFALALEAWMLRKESWSL